MGDYKDFGDALAVAYRWWLVASIIFIPLGVWKAIELVIVFAR